jgi:MFS family permease
MRDMQRQVLLLAGAQALVQIAAVIVMTVGGLAGAQLAEDPRWATLPIATMFLGTATMTFPASMWMGRVGRRAGFLCGVLFGMAGGVVAAYGIAERSLELLVAGTFLLGVYQAFAQFYRFAAGEIADDRFRPRAISLVMSGGVVAAIAGPWLAQAGGPLLPFEYVGSFLIVAAVSLLAGGVLLGLRAPVERGPTHAAAGGRPWREVVLQPAYWVALFGAATGSGVMTLAMTATPIAMHHHHHGLGVTATVIQLHVLGMYLPSFFTGGLIARLGVLRVMLTGVALLAGHILMTLSGTGFGSFASALVLLGMGWNFLYIGGTTLLTTTYAAAEKVKAQATNDMTIFAVGLASSLSSGGLLAAFGWERMNLVLLPWLALAIAALAWLGARQRAVAAAARTN